MGDEKSTVRLLPSTTNDEEELMSVPLTASLLASSMLDQLDPGSLWPEDPNLAVRLFSVRYISVHGDHDPLPFLSSS